MINGKYIYPQELLYITKLTQALVPIYHKDRGKKKSLNFLEYINKGGGGRRKESSVCANTSADIGNFLHSAQLPW